MLVASLDLSRSLVRLCYSLIHRCIISRSCRVPRYTVNRIASVLPESQHHHHLIVDSRHGSSSPLYTAHEWRASKAFRASSSDQEAIHRDSSEKSAEWSRPQARSSSVEQGGVSSRRQSSNRWRCDLSICHHGEQNCESCRRNGRKHHICREVSVLLKVNELFSLACTIKVHD